MVLIGLPCAAAGNILELFQSEFSRILFSGRILCRGQCRNIHKYHYLELFNFAKSCFTPKVRIRAVTVLLTTMRRERTCPLYFIFRQQQSLEILSTISKVVEIPVSWQAGHGKRFISPRIYGTAANSSITQFPRNMSFLVDGSMY